MKLGNFLHYSACVSAQGEADCRFGSSPTFHDRYEPLYMFQDCVSSSYDIPYLSTQLHDVCYHRGREHCMTHRCSQLQQHQQQRKHWLVMGCPASGSRWHYDPFGTSAFNLLLRSND